MRSFAILSFLLFMVVFLEAQNADAFKWEIEVNNILGQSYHYNAPIAFIRCIEGCPVKDQKPGFFQGYQISLSRKLTDRQAVGIGFGYSSYQFPTTYCDLFSIIDNCIVFRRDRKLSYFNYSLHYNFDFFKKGKSTISLQPTIILEQYHERDYVPYVTEWPMAVSADLLYKREIIPSLFFQGGLSFRSSIIPYNNEDFFEKHYPFVYGISLGISKKW